MQQCHHTLSTHVSYGLDISHSVVILISHLEHTSFLCKAYEYIIASLKLSLWQHSLRVSPLQTVDWRVDHVISSRHLQVVM